MTFTFLAVTAWSANVALADGLFAVSADEERKIGAQAAREVESKEHVMGGAFARRVKRSGEDDSAGLSPEGGRIRAPL